MTSTLHGSARRATWLWLLLILATLITWGFGVSGAAGKLAMLALAVVSFWKGAVIILDFMALRHASWLWKSVTLGWMIVVWALIAIAYYKSLGQ